MTVPLATLRIRVRAPRFLLPFWIGIFTVLSGPTAMADGPRECADAYVKAQVERKAGHITAAIQSLTTCAAKTCPSFIRKDCMQWMTDTENAQPSVVFSVRRNGADVTAVEISCDGRILTQSVDGKAIALDPGAHLFTFRIPGGPSNQRQIVIREGERNRIIEVDLESPTPGEPATSEGATSRPIGPLRAGSVSDTAATAPASDRRALSYGLAGVGVLGIAGFAVSGIWGYSQKRDLERSCAPLCDSSQVDPIRTKYIVADVCLGVGLVSLGLATYLFVTARTPPPKGARSETSVTISPTLSGRGGVLDIGGAF